MTNRDSLDYDGLDGITQVPDKKSSWYSSPWLFALALIPLAGAFLLFGSKDQPSTSTPAEQTKDAASLSTSQFSPITSLTPAAETPPLTETMTNPISDQQTPMSPNPDQTDIDEITPQPESISDSQKTDISSETTTPSLFTQQFKFDSSKLIPLSKTELSDLVNAAKTCPNQIKLTGHTCNIGDIPFNQELGMARAKAVKKLLIANGFSAQKISTFSDGMNKPIASNDTRSGKAINRRVELRCLDN